MADEVFTVVDESADPGATGTAATFTVGVIAVGPEGPQGPQGDPGDPGEPGADGSTITAGAGVPSGSANAGDLYINTTNGDLYRFS